MTTPKIRVGDSVLVRCKVELTTEGTTGVRAGRGFSPLSPDFFEIVSVEQAFKVGDRVASTRAELLSAEIVALSPEGVDPPQVWIRVDGRWPLETRNLNSIRRVES